MTDGKTSLDQIVRGLDGVTAGDEIVDALLANKTFVFDPATNFIHADDGGAPEHGIKYVPADLFRDLEERLAKAAEALEFYANPEIYKPHPHGLAFDRRDVSFCARTALTTIRRTEP